MTGFHITEAINNKLMVRIMFSRKTYLLAGIAILATVTTVALSGCDKAKAGWQTGVKDNKIEGTSETMAYRSEPIEGGGEIETDVTCDAGRVNFQFVYLSGKENEANPVGMKWKQYPIGRDGVPVRVRIDDGDIETIKTVSDNINITNLYFMTDKGNLTAPFDKLFSPAPLISFAESKKMMVELPMSDNRNPVIEINRDDSSLNEFFSYCKSVGVAEFNYNSQHKAPRCVAGQRYLSSPNMVAFDKDGLHEQMKGTFPGGDKLIMQGPLEHEPDTLCLAKLEGGGGSPVVVSTLDLLTPDQWTKVPEKAKIEENKAKLEEVRKKGDVTYKRYLEAEQAGNRKLCHDPNTEKGMREMACNLVNETP